MSDQSDQIIIRRLRCGDERLAARLAETFKFARVGDATLSRFLSNSLNFLFIALDGDEPVGFVLAYELQRIDVE
ncbi:MAG TPA: hypothetical protein VKB86_03740, partial [Pyrinomonadaceae bacterium]|nr:hypothetical protein [Pyrinomonadaceae bacterium]